MYVELIETFSSQTNYGNPIKVVVLKIGRRYLLDTYNYYITYKTLNNITIKKINIKGINGEICSKPVTHNIWGKLRYRGENVSISGVVVLGTKRDYFNWLVAR